MWSFVEAAGFAAISIGVALIHPESGLIAAGVSLLIVANGHDGGGT